MIQDILYGRFLENPYYQFIFIALAFYILSKIVQVIILGNLRRLAKKTKNTVDDLIIDSTRKPLIRFLGLIGVKIAVNVLPFSETVLTNFHHIINTLMIIVIIGFLVKISDVFLNVWGRHWAEKTESSLDDELLPLLHKVTHAVIIILGIFFILGEWNIDVTGLLAGVGIAGLAIGFAVKDSLSNIFGGISIILDKAIKVGDVVKLDDGKSGTILDVGLRSTKLRTWNNELLIIPNGQLANTTIQNYKKPDLSVRGEVNFGVEYGANTTSVKKVVKDAIKTIKTVIPNSTKKPIQVLFLNMGDSALEFKARFWVTDYSDKFAAELEATEKIYKALNKSKIGIPFPTRTVYLKKE